MPLEDYYESFYVQNWTSKPDGFGGIIWEWGDGVEIRGVYIQNMSDEVRAAEAQGFKSVGTYITGINVLIEEGDVLRRTKDSAFIKIMGLPINAPEPAISKLRRMNAEIVERSA